MHKYLVALMALVLIAIVNTGSVLAVTAVPSNGITVNDKGSSAVCVAVTTGSAVTVLDGKAGRTSATVYADQAMNCAWGDTAGNAPAVAPTTGAIGTGAGFPFPATTMITLSGNRSLNVGTGVQLNLSPGDRLDCIATTTNGHVCTQEQF